MNKIIYISALFLLISLNGYTADYNIYWKKATSFYLQKQYDSAASYFEQVAASKPHNAELYYNLGNVYYRMNRIAQAVLNYERALRINPSFTQAQDNLAITHARINNHTLPAEDIFFIAWWKSITDHTNATMWAVVGLFFFILSIFFLWVKKYTTLGSSLPFQLPGILAFVCVITLIFCYKSSRNFTNYNGAIVMENDAPLMNELQKGKPIALIPEGTSVKILKQNGNWIEVSLPDSRSGWLLASQIEKI
jgi:tetratricopeptide (TPR) repeat protein